MKVTNWRRKLAAALVAGGLMTPATSLAQSLDTNLVVDPGFENVNTGITGPFDSVALVDWQDTGLDGDSADDSFAFVYSADYSGTNVPPGAATYHYTGGFNTTPGEAVITQSLSLDSGDVGGLIPTGEAAYDLRAYFSTYREQVDASRVRVRFLDSGGTEVGRGEAGGAAFVAGLGSGTAPDGGSQRDWGQDVNVGLIPANAVSAAVEIVPDVATTNHDGYVDLVDLQVTTASSRLMFLEVDTETGGVSLLNQTGENIAIDYYEILSAGDSLDEGGWSSFQDQNTAGFPAGNGTGNGWEEAGGSAPGVLSESYLTGSSVVSDGAAMSLGDAYDTGVAAQDLVFRYAVLSGTPDLLEADFNKDGDVDGDDFLIWQSEFGTPSGATPNTGDTDGDGDVDGDDFLTWQAQFGSSASGASGPGTLITGFVRYVSANQAAAIPEPASVLLVGIGLAGLASARRVSRRDPVR